MTTSFQLNPHAAQRLLRIFLDADLHYQLAGTPHAEYLQREAHRYHGQTHRILAQVAVLGPRATLWMDYFMREMGSALPSVQKRQPLLAQKAQKVPEAADALPSAFGPEKTPPLSSAF